MHDTCILSGGVGTHVSENPGSKATVAPKSDRNLYPFCAELPSLLHVFSIRDAMYTIHDELMHVMYF